MQDIQLKEGEFLVGLQQSQQQQEPTATEAQLPEQVASTTAADSLRGKSNSLKRFFKLGKKSGTQSESALQLEARVAADGGETVATSGGSVRGLETTLEGKDLRGSTRRRFHLRLRTPNKGTADGSNESSPKPPPPPPNLKPTLKSSISSYWHSLFKRHQGSSPSVNKDTEQANVTVAAVADSIAQAVTSTADAAELGEAHAVTNKPILGGGVGVLDDKSHNMTASIEEIQELAISEEVEEDQHGLASATAAN